MWEKPLCQQMMLEQLNIHLRNNEFGLLPPTIHKKFKKGLIDPHVGTQIIKFLEEITGINFHNLQLGNDFLHLTLEVKATTVQEID